MIGHVRPLGVALSVAAAFGIAGLSQVPYDAVGREEAVVRLAWRASGERVEECRKLSEEELEKVAPHMRRPEVCEGRILPYHLLVKLDGQTVIDEIIQPSGARADRPLYVFREIHRAPGEQALSVEWRQVREDENDDDEADDEDSARSDPGGDRGDDDDNDDEHGDDRGRGGGEDGRIASRLVQLDTIVHAGPREVILVTLERAGDALIIRTGE